MYTRIGKDVLKKNMYHRVRVPLKNNHFKEPRKRDYRATNDDQNVGDFKIAERRDSDGTQVQNTRTQMDNSKMTLTDQVGVAKQPLKQDRLSSRFEMRASLAVYLPQHFFVFFVMWRELFILRSEHAP
jgi:hypothetical protein